MIRHLAAVCAIAAGSLLSGCAYGLAPYPGAYAGYPIARPAMMPPMDNAARGRWDNVMRLPFNSVVDVLATDGTAHVGTITHTDGYAVRVMARGVEEEIARADVVRVDLVSLPGSDAAAVAKHAGAGALTGMAFVALIGAVIGGPAWPPQGASLRMGAALGGISGAEQALATRQPRLVYLAEHQAIVPRPSSAATITRVCSGSSRGC